MDSLDDFPGANPGTSLAKSLSSRKEGAGKNPEVSSVPPKAKSTVYDLADLAASLQLQLDNAHHLLAQALEEETENESK